MTSPGPAAADAHPATTALALSGGGARMSFELGALRYLYQETDVHPGLFTATSAGAIIAAMLAQAADRAAQSRQLDALIAHFQHQGSLDDMFQRTELAERLLRGETQGQLDDVLGTSHPRTPGIDPMRAVALVKSLSLLNLLEISTEPSHQSVFTAGPGLQRMTGEDMQNSHALAQAGTRVRLSMISLESGELHFATETGAIVDRLGQEIAPPRTVSLGQAVLASCSLPGVLPPVALHEGHYVDGGLRKFLPVQCAIDQLGATKVIAISTRPVGAGRLASFANAGIVEIMSRMHGDVTADEIQRDELAYARDHDVQIIQCLAPMHSAFDFNPVLMLLSMDDGWMAAAASTRGIDPMLGAQVSAERRALAHAYLADAGASALDGAKARLTATIEQAPEGLLPPHSDRWLLSPQEIAEVSAQDGARSATVAESAQGRDR